MNPIWKRVSPLLLVILIALFLRAFQLVNLPPGLTHDEANHGREAIGILDGVFLFYFPLNYGSEPLYSYAVAASMLLLGENLFALRLVNVAAGLAVIVLSYYWALRVFDRHTAILTAALLAISFWPIASSRQALRAGMLPFFTTLTVLIFWNLPGKAWDNEYFSSMRSKRSLLFTLLFGFSLAITFHIYLAARVAWLMYPTFILYLASFHRQTLRRTWLPIVLGLLLAGLLVLPMFSYLADHPEAQTRLSMLSGPLEELRAGRVTPLLENARKALLAFIWPGYGDDFLAYNIPGRPVLDAMTASFFVLGVLISVKRWRHPAYAFLLLWFIFGISPSLVTGSSANSTRNLAALPTIFLLAAVGFRAAARLSKSVIEGLKRGRYAPQMSGTIIPAVTGLWLLAVGWTSIHDYFVTWGESPEVRAAYQHTVVEMLRFLEAQPTNTPHIVSSVYPGPAHDPSIAKVLLPEPGFEMRWMDARSALLFPDGFEVSAIVPTSTPLHPAFHGLFDLVSSVSLRPDDLDPGFSTYRVNDSLLKQWMVDQPVDFGGAISLYHTSWLLPAYHPGAKAELLTLWKVIAPERVGPVVPPAYTTDVVLFTHVLDDSGEILAQRDVLDAPSWDWHSGDIVLQIHSLEIPEGTAPGSYETVIGLYDRLTEERVPVVSEEGELVGTRAEAAPLRLTNP